MLRALYARAVAAVRAINLFPQYVVVDEARQRVHAWRKSMLFVACFSTAACATILASALTPITTKQMMLNPTLAEYSKVMDFDPSCTCGRVASIGEVAALRIPPAGNLTLNACGTASAVFLEAYSLFHSGNQSAIPNVRTAALALSVLDVLSQGCIVLSQLQGAAVASVLNQPLNPNLLAPGDLNRTILDTASKALQNMAVFTQTMFTSLSYMESSYPAGFMDYSSNATERSPNGCSCGGMLQSLPDPEVVMSASRGCQFKVSFDWRNVSSDPTKPPNSTWSCSTSHNAVHFPLELLDAPLYALLGLQPPYDRYAYATSSMAPSFQYVYWLPTALAFEMYSMYTPNYNAFQPGVLSVDYAAYYGACKPSSCTYTVTGTPSALSAFTSSLGIISGLQTILMILIGTLYMRFVEGKDAHATTSVTLEDVPTSATASSEGSIVEQRLRVKPSRRRPAGASRPLPPGPAPSTPSSGASASAGGPVRSVASPRGDNAGIVLNPLGASHAKVGAATAASIAAHSASPPA